MVHANYDTQHPCVHVSTCDLEHEFSFDVWTLLQHDLDVKAPQLMSSGVKVSHLSNQ
jgi:hypothetical protein